jgi:hypothetical protein
MSRSSSSGAATQPYYDFVVVPFVAEDTVARSLRLGAFATRDGRRIPPIA